MHPSKHPQLEPQAEYICCGWRAETTEDWVVWAFEVWIPSVVQHSLDDTLRSLGRHEDGLEIKDHKTECDKVIIFSSWPIAVWEIRPVPRCFLAWSCLDPILAITYTTIISQQSFEVAPSSHTASRGITQGLMTQELANWCRTDKMSCLEKSILPLHNSEAFQRKHVTNHQVERTHDKFARLKLKISAVYMQKCQGLRFARYWESKVVLLDSAAN